MGGLRARTQAVLQGTHSYAQLPSFPPALLPRFARLPGPRHRGSAPPLPPPARSPPARPLP
eukprot:751233-Prorocentrum_lima.AAC.1